MLETFKKLFTPVESFTPDEARDFINRNQQGTYTLLDVRQPKEYEDGHIAGARLAPLPLLAEHYSEIDRSKPVIVYCASGGRSRVAAQLLAGKDFGEVYNLTGGIKAWNGEVAVGPLEMNMDLITGDETPSEVVALAYTMEKNLGKFYHLARQRTANQSVAKLLGLLASVEEKHKDFLIDLFEKMEPEKDSRTTLDNLSLATTMEGGFDTDAFLEQNEQFLQEESDILDLAMMLETQALDLYIRFGSKMENVQSRNALNKIADEEKEHLKALGNLRNETT